MSDWGTSSGLLDEFTATVESSKFATDVNYRDGQVPRLEWDLVRVENDEDVQVEEPMTEKFGVGNGYVVIDDGAGVEREDGNTKRKFNKKSRYGEIIDRVVKNTDGAFDGLLDLVQERGTPNEAEVWVGLRFEFSRVNASFRNDDDELIEYDYILPSKFLGVDQDVAQPTGKSGAGSLREQVEQVARDSSDYEEFVSKALAVKGVTSDKELVAAISDESDDGLYAQASA